MEPEGRAAISGRSSPPVEALKVALATLAIMAACSGSARADELGVRQYDHDDVVAALEGQSVMVRRIIYCEVGRSGRYDPYAVGSSGEVGPAQLLPGAGNGLAIFYRWGFSDPNSPAESVAFVNEVIRRDMLGSQYPRTSRGCEGSP